MTIKRRKSSAISDIDAIYPFFDGRRFSSNVIPTLLVTCLLVLQLLFAFSPIIALGFVLMSAFETKEEEDL